MKTHRLFLLLLITFLCCNACKKEDTSSPANNLTPAISDYIAQTNSNIGSLKRILVGYLQHDSIRSVSTYASEKHYQLSIAKGNSPIDIYGTYSPEAITHLSKFQITVIKQRDSNSWNWALLKKGTPPILLTDEQNQPIQADAPNQSIPIIGLSADGKWQFSMNKGANWKVLKDNEGLALMLERAGIFLLPEVFSTTPLTYGPGNNIMVELANELMTFTFPLQMKINVTPWTNQEVTINL